MSGTEKMREMPRAVLVVDDDETVREVLTEMLAPCGAV